jgi:hypothetical protein
VILIFLAFVGKISTFIELTKERQAWAAVFGFMFLISGIVLFVTPNAQSRPAIPAASSTQQPMPVIVPSTATNAPALPTNTALSNFGVEGPTMTPTSTRILSSTLGLTENSVLLYSTLDDVTAITAPAIGIGGKTTLAATDFVSAHVGNGAQFSHDDPDCKDPQVVTFPVTNGSVQNVELDRGELAFWYRPTYDAADFSRKRTLMIISIDGYNPPALRLDTLAQLMFSAVEADWTAHSTATDYGAPLWKAGNWAHIRATWDRWCCWRLEFRIGNEATQANDRFNSPLRRYHR